MSNFEMGSVWRKWDLHVHTPKTKLDNQYKAPDGVDLWDYFCEKIEKSDVDVFGITDYFSVENYFTFIEKFKAKYPESRKVFFPNIEYRIDSKNSKGEHIQFHVVFSNEEPILKRLKDFLTRLKLVSTDNDKLTNRYCKDDDLKEISHEKAMVKIDDLKDQLKNDFANDEYLIAGVINGYGSFRPSGEKDGRGAEYAKELDKKCDFFFGNSKNTEFYLNAGIYGTERKKYKLDPKPVLYGCDAHSFEILDRKLGKSFAEQNGKNNEYSEITWIKADPTFQGLRQIICEPEGRVKIRANKPDEKSGYSVIKSTEIISQFCRQKILFNSNLNAIIGGRSTGKSTLLQLIAHRINPNIKDIDNSIVTNSQEDEVSITWQDDEENKDRDIDFFEQGYMFKIANEKDQKNTLIRDIVKDQSHKNPIDAYEKFCSANERTIYTDLHDLFQLQDDLNNKAVELKEKGDENGLRKEILSLQNSIQESQQNNNFSNDYFNQYTLLNSEILGFEQHIKKLKNDHSEVIELKNEDLFDKSFTHKFNQLSNLNSENVEKILHQVKKDTIRSWQNKLSNVLTDIDNKIGECDNKIQDKKSTYIFKNGNAQLEHNKQYKELCERLKVEERKLSDILSLKDRITSIEKQKEALFSKVINDHAHFASKLGELISSFSLAHDDIEIKVGNIFHAAECQDTLKEFINLKSHDMRNFVGSWGKKYHGNVKESIKNFLKKSLDGSFDLKANKDTEGLAKALLARNWFSISYELTYQNDTFDDMSHGKKAFVILKLLLEFSKKNCPILIDQPEDSLDNRAIYNELVTYLKEKKKKRQIILITHNANIVVNADAEEVIVANQHGENSKNKNNIKFQYISGSLEKTTAKSNSEYVLKSQGIREHVCEILEGGAEAFKKREDKYAIRR